MSTTRNRNKEEGDQTSGNSRRSAKSIGPTRDSLTPQDSPVQASTPYLYQCVKCNFILANSNNLLKNLTENSDLLFFPPESENFLINSKDIQISSEATFDQFCAYNPVRCGNCKFTLGKYYLSLTEKMSLAKNAVVIPEGNLFFYDVKNARIATPSGKKSKTKAEQTTAKKIVNTSVVKAGKENKALTPVQAQPQVQPQESDRMVDISKSVKTKERKLSPEVGKMEEQKINYEKKPSGQLSAKEDQQMKEVETCFAEMKGVLSNFAALLESFDARISSTENTIETINKAVNQIMNNMNIAECIDLTD